MTYNLWEVERVIADGVEDEVLELVDGPKQIFPECRHVAGSWMTWKTGWKTSSRLPRERKHSKQMVAGLEKRVCGSFANG